MSGNIFNRAVLFFLSSVLFSLAAVSANASATDSSGTDAQSTPSLNGAAAAAAPAEVRDDGMALEQIVVTATRTDRDVGKVPISITAFTQKGLDQRGVNSIDDIAQFTPGISFQRGNAGDTTVSIRGISSDAGSSPTGVYINDTPIQSRVIGFSSTTVFPVVFDLQRVEILRGPQGTLFGAGSEGGTIRFITPEASLDTFTSYGKSELAFTEHGDQSYEAGYALGGPIVEDEVGFRASIAYRRDGGYVDKVDKYTGDLVATDPDWTRNYSARLAFSIKPVDGLYIKPSFYFQQLYVNDAQTYWNYLSDPGRGVFNNGATATAPFQGTTYLPSLNVSYEMPWFNIISNTSFFEQSNWNNRDMGSIIPNALGITVSPAQPDPVGIPDFRSQDLFVDTQRAWTQEVRLQSKDSADSRLNWVLGFFFQRENQSSHQFVPDTPSDFNLLSLAAFGEPASVAFPDGLFEGKYSYRSFIESVDKQSALFGQIDYKVIGGLTLTAGVRAAKATFSVLNTSDGPFNGGSTVVPGNESETPITPKYGVSYAFDDHNMMYASASKGYRTGGANSGIPSRCDTDLNALGYTSAPVSYGPDSVWNYEVGSKNQLLKGRLQLAGSVYYDKWSGIQESISLPSCALNFVANLGEATSKGFDLQGDLLLGSQLTLGLAAGYNKAEYSKSLYSAPNPLTGIQSSVALQGNALSEAHPWTVALNARYDFHVWERAGYFRVDYEYASEQTTPTAGEDPRNQIYTPGFILTPATNLVSMRLGTTSISDWDISLFVNNVFDSHIPFYQNGGAEDLIYTQRTFRPRTIGITFLLRR
ncbi:MAG TPA: TonB-dependent receptor [Steroidobacteraceae bacterium]|jgi:outer membrane receptor protein involved in Fe transport|nr:TonB-dependent receptor [Steroidobacteraceae bacterium]